ncbi:MAG: Mov34/MPN/PAD-1 family protein [Candidatus Sifarchaeia archaeon]
MPLFKEVILTKNLQQKMLEAARNSYPLEGCGVLIGLIDNNKAIIRDVIETENSAKNPSVRFYIDPELFYTILISAEESGLEFLGIFHSHPAQPNPSPWDLEYMKLHQNVWIIIQSFNQEEKKPKMKAFQWYDEKLLDVKIKIS